jgi:hypothetical protein
MARLIILTAVGLAAVAAAAPAPAATTAQRLPVNFVAPGCDEPILLTGTLEAVLTTTPNGSGGFLVSFHFNPQGVTGLGLTSGAIYHGTGVTREDTTVNGATTVTFVNNFKIIGTGTTPNLLIMDVIHTTVDANGDITAVVDQESLMCRP